MQSSYLSIAIYYSGTNDLTTLVNLRASPLPPGAIQNLTQSRVVAREDDIKIAPTPLTLIETVDSATVSLAALKQREQSDTRPSRITKRSLREKYRHAKVPFSVKHFQLPKTRLLSTKSTSSHIRSSRCRLIRCWPLLICSVFMFPRSSQPRSRGLAARGWGRLRT